MWCSKVPTDKYNNHDQHVSVWLPLHMGYDLKCPTKDIPRIGNRAIPVANGGGSRGASGAHTCLQGDGACQCSRFAVKEASDDVPKSR